MTETERQLNYLTGSNTSLIRIVAELKDQRARLKDELADLRAEIRAGVERQHLLEHLYYQAGLCNLPAAHPLMIAVTAIRNFNPDSPQPGSASQRDAHTVKK